MSTNESLLEEIRRLGPWHHDIQLTADLSTGRAFSESGTAEREDNEGVSLLALRDEFLQQVDAIYPEGLKGKRFLDCACNAGGYCFWARERQVDLAYGFDIREHWIDQAEFVRKHRSVFPTDRIKFSVCDLYDLPNKQLPEFDLTLFKGIFYHLPEPISGLRIAANLTREVLVLNTQTFWGFPDGFMRPGREDISKLMSGAYGLNWRPTGPNTLIPVLRWLGFKEAKLLFHMQNAKRPNLGRMSIVASKVLGRLDPLNCERIIYSDSGT